MKKNLAAILNKQKRSLSILNLDMPKVPNGYALLKMRYSGICHTQLNEISGILGKDKFMPHCMGHEGVGEIISLAKDVKGFKRGDKVVVSWVKKKNNKKILNTFYTYNSRKINTGGCNTLLNYSLVSEDRIFKINKRNLYLRESILLGCALPTASNAILNNSSVNKKSKVLIMGMGGLGYASLFVLNYLKCEDVTCIDINSKKLNILKKQKKTKFFLINKKKLDEMVKKNKDKFDLIIDCTGSKKLIEKTFSLCKRFVGKFIMIGNTKVGEKISINAWDFIFGKTFTGAWGNGGTTMKNFKINEKILISEINNIKKILPKKNYKITEINKALKDFKKGKVLRSIIKF
mgnify:FL=1